MKEKLTDLLNGKLTKKEIELVPKSYDVVGDILIFVDFPEELVEKEKIIGQAFIDYLKNVNVVCKKTGMYSGTFRTPKLKVIAGDNRKETLHKENNSRLKLDVEKVYFSVRSGNERLRISTLVKKCERILVMFSGAAPFPVVIARNTSPKEIIGVEINPAAHKYALENAKMSKRDNIILINGDVRDIVPKLKGKFDRIIMPLPKTAEEFLDVAITKISSGGTVHYYDFLSEDEFAKGKEKIKSACKKAGKKSRVLKIVKCGNYSPGTYRVCIDFKVY